MPTEEDIFNYAKRKLAENYMRDKTVRYTPEEFKTMLHPDVPEENRHETLQYLLDQRSKIRWMAGLPTLEIKDGLKSNENEPTVAMEPQEKVGYRYNKIAVWGNFNPREKHDLRERTDCELVFIDAARNVQRFPLTEALLIVSSRGGSHSYEQRILRFYQRRGADIYHERRHTGTTTITDLIFFIQKGDVIPYSSAGNYKNDPVANET